MTLLKEFQIWHIGRNYNFNLTVCSSYPFTARHGHLPQRLHEREEAVEVLRLQQEQRGQQGARGRRLLGGPLCPPASAGSRYAHGYEYQLENIKYALV